MNELTSDRHLAASRLLAQPRVPVHVVLDNLRSAFNVGSIIRTSDAGRVACVHCCGITPCPPHPQLARTALGATRYVPWVRHERAIDAVSRLRENGCAVVALETGAATLAYTGASYDLPLALVLGHEVSGVSPDVLDACDLVVSIPMWGVKNSINVATSFGIVLYEILRRHAPSTP